MIDRGWARRFTTGLSSLRDRAAARLAALRFNPSRRQKLGVLAFFFVLVFAAAGAQGHIWMALFYLALAWWSLCLMLRDEPA